MNETERELDLTVAELNVENKMLKEQNERLTRELIHAQAHRNGLQDALARILAVSRMAIWNGEPEGVNTLGKKERHKECND